MELALQHYWDIVTAVRRIQDDGMEYLPGRGAPTLEPPQLIRRTSDALRLLIRYGRDAGERTESQENPHLLGFLRRAPEHACRLAALMVVWECYATRTTSGGRATRPLLSATVDEGTLQRAITLVDWYGGELARVSQDSGYTDVALYANRLSRLLSKAAVGEIVQNSRTGRGYLAADGRVQVRALISQRIKDLAKDPELQERVLNILERQEHIRMDRRSQCYVNPKLPELYADT